MDQRAILTKIEHELTENSTVRRRPFGIDCIHNIAKAITYLYDNSHRTGRYQDVQHLSSLLTEEFHVSKMTKWPAPTDYLIENDRGHVLVKVTTWKHKLTLSNIQIDKIIRVTYVYRVQPKHEFHVRVVE